MLAASDYSAPLFVFLGVCVTAIGAWLINRRQNSGKIDTSEAAKLWEESTGMRHELRDQVAALQDEIKAMKVEYQQLKDKSSADIQAARDAASTRIETLRAEVNKLRARVLELESAHG